MRLDIDKMRDTFFKKCLSVGHHNIQYTWMQLMLMIISCVRSLESFEEGALSPSAQTLRDRLDLGGAWMEVFHDSMWRLAKLLLRKFGRYCWWISIDETYTPFFGNRKKLNARLKRKKIGKFVHGYRAKTPGATGSFCFLVISLCCAKVRIPIAIKMVPVGQHSQPWLESWLTRLLALAPKAIVLADRGFGKAVWFYDMLEHIGATFVVRVPLRKKENKNKVKAGVPRFQYWMKEQRTNRSVLLTVHVANDKKKRTYLLASNIENKTARQLLAMYLNRWDLENIFKDADRVQLPTSSRNPRMRLFSVVLSFFLFALWQAQRLVFALHWSLRTFVKHLMVALCTSLHCFLTSLGEIVKPPP